MYYSKGNYEAFAKPEKPKDADKKSAHIVGAGLSALAAACFMIRDGQVKGNNIHIYEELSIPGGACDGIYNAQKGYVIRGGREMESHFECLWDLYRSIPSIETEGVTVLDEYYQLNKKDPNSSLMRVIKSRGEDSSISPDFKLSEKATMEILKLYMTCDKDLYDLKISDVLSSDFFSSEFWLCWRTMFAFEEWHSALEMKLYLHRFIHHIGGLKDFSTLKFTKYNQYESLILPLVSYLNKNGVHFHYDTTVTNVIFDITSKEKLAKKIEYTTNSKSLSKELTRDDLVFITNGSCTENSTLGDANSAPTLNKSTGACWQLWRNIAKQDDDFGRPDKFCTNINATNWESATITTQGDKITPYIEKICKRDPFNGRVVTGGIVTVRDSKWLMSFTISRQPHFKSQPKDKLVVWVYSLFSDVSGDYIKKPMKECTGIEITKEWLYHIGVPINEIDDMALNSASCIPCMMPFVTAFFMPRTAGDRPKVVPKKSVNFAFIGQFADTNKDTVFTTEYSVRTAMEAVYTLLEIDRGVPEVFGSSYDIRVLLDSTSKMMCGKKLTDMNINIPPVVMKNISGTVIEELLKEYNLL